MAYPESRNLKEVEDTLPVQCGEEETEMISSTVLTSVSRPVAMEAALAVRRWVKPLLNKV